MCMEVGKLFGIVNGIDSDLLNLEIDVFLLYYFLKSNLEGKIKNKLVL